MYVPGNRKCKKKTLAPSCGSGLAPALQHWLHVHCTEHKNETALGILLFFNRFSSSFNISAESRATRNDTITEPELYGDVAPATYTVYNSVKFGSKWGEC
jgi:hypothetical protein